jgi:2-methylcitrate dehydratase PrpD
VDAAPAYAVAFTDWLACACAGADERAAQAVRATGDHLITRVAFAGTAGHVLDYDDTFADGVAHVSAACAPAALMTAAHLGSTIGSALASYAEGYEAMAAVAAASHPALYDAGWHPTAVLAPIGAVVAASALLGLNEAQRHNAVALAVLRAGGTRGAFGSDGKAIQVGLAAAAGVQAALLAREGATVDPRAIDGPIGFEAVIGATWATPEPGAPAIDRNWIKLHPSCLGTHSPIEAASQLRDREEELDPEPLRVIVDPVSRQAAHLDRAEDGLSAKFSIPYCVAFTLIHGPPGVRDFAAVEPAAAERAGRIAIEVDDTLPEFSAVLVTGGRRLALVEAPKGSPRRPATREELEHKLSDLAGERLDGVLVDDDAPAATLLHAAGLRIAVPAPG